LPWNNELRWYGQSENCCPKGFYENQIHSCTETYPFVPEYKQNDLRNVVPRTLNINNFLNLPTMVKMKTTKNNLGEQDVVDMVYEKCEIDVTDDMLQNFYLSRRDPYQWYHQNYKFHLFKNYIYYQHCDLRKQIIHERKPNDSYIFDAIMFCANPDLKDYNGVKGLWYEYKLPYVKMEDTVNWDPMHVFKNISDRMFDVWIGERFKDKVVIYCEAIQIHPEFTLKKQPWSIGTKKIETQVIMLLLKYDDFNIINIYYC
jgi:hypothetical protein